MDERPEDNKGARPSRYKRRVQIISIIVIALLLAGATVACIPLIKDLNSTEGIDRMKERLESYGGFLGGLIFTAIQALQVVVAIVPPVQILGGVLFGWFAGALLSIAGVFIGAAVVFLIVNKFGRPLVEAFVDEESFHRFRFLQDEKKLVGILMLLYIIPGIPKDVLTYIVPLTKVSKRDFFLLVMPCRIPAIVLSTVFGSNVKSGNFVAAVIIVGVFAVMAVAGFFFREPLLAALNRRKHQKDDDSRTDR